MFQLQYNKIFSYIYYLIIIVTIVIFIIVGLFLYKNLYQTLIQADEIIIMRSELINEDIDIDKFERIIKRLGEKIKLQQ